MGRSVRMGIDVGGTHTKAVAIDNATHEIIGKSSVKTTHDDPRGVAAGVVKSFENCLNENGISPDDVVFVAHSTTQATNALIEGDVATVGVIGMAKGGLEGFLAKKQTKLDDIDLGNQKKIKIVNDFINVKKMNMAVVEDTMRQRCMRRPAPGASPPPWPATSPSSTVLQEGPEPLPSMPPSFQRC